MREDGVYTTKSAMKDFQDGLAQAYPRWWAYLQSLVIEGTAQGYLRNSFGRVRRFTAPEKDGPAMKNFPAQGDVGDIGWSTYRQLWEEAQKLGGRLSILVHDEVVVQVPRERVKDAADMLRDVMEQEFDEVAPGFRIPIKVKVGAKWGPTMVPEGEWR
jgi:DNA polymerase I-like protein with 3'-5' exonuclease and polymerase domains